MDEAAQLAAAFDVAEGRLAEPAVYEEASSSLLS